MFINLGCFVDVTEEPKQSDIIVSLGDDFSGCRLKKALSIYKKGYSSVGKLVYTGRDALNPSIDASGSKTTYLLRQNLKNKEFTHIDKSIILNTMEEVLFIKKYMLYHNYKSVMFVSHPQHSRRIKVFAEYIANYKESGLDLSIVSCDPIWWSKKTYYLNKTALKVTIYEIVKLFYNLIKYGTPLINYTKYSQRMKNNDWNIILKKLNWHIEPSD